MNAVLLNPGIGTQFADYLQRRGKATSKDTFHRVAIAKCQALDEVVAALQYVIEFDGQALSKESFVAIAKRARVAMARWNAA